MRVSDARKLRDGQKVFIDYHGTPGHCEHVFCQGIVEGSYENVKPQRNLHDVEYIGVSVKYQGTRSVFPSFCLSKV